MIGPLYDYQVHGADARKAAVNSSCQPAPDGVPQSGAPSSIRGTNLFKILRK
jgi:hypothetical protein